MAAANVMELPRSIRRRHPAAPSAAPAHGAGTASVAALAVTPATALPAATAAAAARAAPVCTAAWARFSAIDLTTPPCWRILAPGRSQAACDDLLDVVAVTLGSPGSGMPGLGWTGMISLSRPWCHHRECRGLHSGLGLRRLLSFSDMPMGPKRVARNCLDDRLLAGQEHLKVGRT